MPLIAKAGANCHPGKDPIDWPRVKAEILARLDLAAEYEALGLEWTSPSANAKGWRECRALGRADARPSAAVNLKSGVYHDSGGEGLTLGFFDFALKHGGFGRWIEVVKHYSAKAGVELGSVPTHGAGRIREATYLYRDAAGALKYAVFRYRLPNGKKSFSQHPPDGRGGWKHGAGCMEGVDPLPYRLPELLAADPAETVWVVEGEKDAELLAGLGLVATTSSQGCASAAKVWPWIAAHFRGRNVVVLPDRDAGGHQYARNVAESLLGVAASVKVLELPGLPPKGDVSDWFDLGGTLEELKALAVAAPEWTPDGPDEDLDRDATAADLIRLNTTIRWVWPNWIPLGVLTILAADAGIGKTRFCADLLRRACLGLPWPDGAMMELAPDTRALWVAADNQHPELGTLPGMFGFPPEQLFLNATVRNPFLGTMLDAAEDLEDFEARIVRLNPVFVFIDTSLNATDRSAHKPEDAKAFFTPLQRIAQRTQTAIVCVTHLNGSGKPLGRRIVAQGRVVIQLEKPDPEQEHRRKLWVVKSNSLYPPPLGVTMKEDGNDYDTTPPVAPAAAGAFPVPSANGHAGKRGPVPLKLQAAMDWLLPRLAGGRRRSYDMRNEAAEDGIIPSSRSAATLYRALHEIGGAETDLQGSKYFELASKDEIDF